MGPCISYLGHISFPILLPNVLCVFRTIKEQGLSHFLMLRRRALQNLQTTIMFLSPVIQVRSFFLFVILLCYINDSFFFCRPTILLLQPGDLVLIHGAVLHKSKRNTSSRTRFAYTFHMIDSPPHAGYDNKNWLQPTKEMPFSKILP